jgi:hypothetical protein
MGSPEEDVIDATGANCIEYSDLIKSHIKSIHLLLKKYRMDRLKQIEAFVSAATRGSLSAAARVKV